MEKIVIWFGNETLNIYVYIYIYIYKWLKELRWEKNRFMCDGLVSFQKISKVNPASWIYIHLIYIIYRHHIHTGKYTIEIKYKIYNRGKYTIGQ